MGFDRGAITNQGSAWAEVCMHQAHTHKAMVDHIFECRKRMITFFACSSYALNVLVQQELKPRNIINHLYWIYWIQRVRGMFVLLSWLKAPSVPLIDTKQKLCYTTHRCCFCALKCVFGLYWLWGHIFFCCRKKLSSHVEICPLNVELKYQGCKCYLQWKSILILWRIHW